MLGTDSWFARRLRRTLGDMGISQRKLARMSGLSDACISRYMSGSRLPNLHNVKRIRDALGCTWEEILG